MGVARAKLLLFILYDYNEGTLYLNMYTMKVIKIIALVLLVVGGLNWGLVGVAQFDLVATIFGDGSVLSRIVYSLV